MRWHLNFGIGLAALLLSVLPASAQVKAGENTNLSLTGDLSFGYSGEYGDSSGSSHGLNIGGQGLLGGYYYNPNFVTFRAQPYYNRSQNNSASQSISDSSGFQGEVDFFRSSHFPGSVSYGKVFDGSGQFGTPGVAGFTTHGGGQTFGVTWSELLPDWPTLMASYSSNSEHSEIYGTSGESRGVSRVFQLQSNYTLADFRLTGIYTHQSQHASFPEVLTGQAATDSSYGTNSFNFLVTHKLPLTGQWEMGWTHSSFGGDSRSGGQTTNSDGSNNLLNTGVTLSPVRKLSLSFNANYNTNVFATLQQQILQAGGEVFTRNTDWSSSALSLNGFAFYTVNSHIALTGSWGRQTQFFSDGSHSVMRYAGTVNSNYSHKFLGSFHFSVGMVDLANEQGNQGAAVVGNVSFTRRVNGWELGAGFSYSQYVQTLLVTRTTSSYNYNANFRRRFRSGMYWSGAFLTSRSGMTQVAGMSNHAESVNTSFLLGRYSLNGTYTQSSGTSLLTGAGLVQPPGGVPGDLVQLSHYGTKGFGFGGGATIKRSVWTVNYSKSNGNLLGGPTPSIYDSRSLNARLQYRVRKMYFNSGYTRFHQNFGVVGSQPIDFNTYFVGFTRWFNVF